jgi:hypothetical protein
MANRIRRRFRLSDSEPPMTTPTLGHGRDPQIQLKEPLLDEDHDDDSLYRLRVQRGDL